MQGKESDLFRRAVSSSAAGCTLQRPAAPQPQWDEDYGLSSTPIKVNPTPVLPMTNGESEEQLKRDAGGDVVGPQLRWQTALRALMFVRHLSSY